ncbi:MAG: 2,3-bisphosphoglycerate-independent phosphoglycerate mutase [Bacteroidota bacterium]
MKADKVVLIIMDGWGLAENPDLSAIAKADTPFFDSAMATWPNMRLQASGLPVGLPDGQMGNSEVGHMNIGAGRIVYQDLVRINREIESGDFASNPNVQNLTSYCRTKKKPVHLLGLLSDGGVHSSIHHLKGIVQFLAQDGVEEIYIHCFMDGRDTSPHGGKSYIADLESSLAATGTGKIASMIGRYYAMDRDKRWERVKLAYDLLVHGKGSPFSSAGEAIADAYAADETDEFVQPRIITENGAAVATIQPEDAVLFFNFRTDRGRQLTHVLTQKGIPDQEMETLPLYYTTMTRYDDSFQGIHVLYEKDEIKNGLGDYLSSIGKKQIRIAETEKYPHVTFFFNGGREKEAEGESYLLCPSPKVATYDLQPEMSAQEIQDSIIPELEKGEVDFVCLNFANPDMVGHTGVFEAAVKACEVVDQCTKAVVDAAGKHGYICLITADHGNADRMKNDDGSPHTAHTTVLVPFILRDPQDRYSLKVEIGKLGDIAPTILQLMGVGIPDEMTGDVLIEPIRAKI